MIISGTTSPPARRRTRVCIVGPSTRFLSGISYYTLRLANALADQYDVSVVLLRDLVPRGIFPGASRVGRVLTQLSFDPRISVYDGVDWHWVTSAVPALVFLLRTKPDVLILQWWTSAVLHTELLLSLFNAVGPRAQRIIEFHEILDTRESNLRPLVAYTSLFRRLLIRNAAAYVAHSHIERAQLQQTLDLPGDRTFVVPHGTYDHFTTGASTRAAPDAPFTYLYFGLVRPYKGVDLLVKAFDCLSPEEAAQSRLLVVGEPWEGHLEPYDAVRASRYRDRITVIARYVSDAEVGTFFAQADAAVFPYRRASQSGASHVAMAWGLPVVASRVGGLAEALAEYEGTLFCEPEDISDLAGQLRAVRGRRGQRYADPFDWSRTTDAYARVFEAIT